MTSKMKQGTIRGAIAAGVAGGAILVGVLGSGAASGGPQNDCYGGPQVLRAGCVIITTPSTSTTAVTVTTTAPQQTTVPEVTTTMVEETSTTMGETTTTMPAVQGNAAAATPVRAQANFTG